MLAASGATNVEPLQGTTPIPLSIEHAVALRVVQTRFEPEPGTIGPGEVAMKDVIDGLPGSVVTGGPGVGSGGGFRNEITRRRVVVRARAIGPRPWSSRCLSVTLSVAVKTPSRYVCSTR